jgi:hypothetical protein
MLDTDISLNGDAETTPGTTEGSLTYSASKFSSDGIRRDVASLAGSTPQSLTISHQDTKKNGLSRKRTLVRVDCTVDDSNSGLVDYSVYLVMDRPVGTDVTSDNVIAALGRLMKLCATSGIPAKLLNGEP